VDRFLEIAGLITRWFMAALACWWLFWFITLIGASSDNAQYLAGTALMKAIICGGAAGIWFYRARTAKATKSLREDSLRSQQPFPTELPRVIPAPELHQDTQPATVVSAPQKASEPQGTTKMICGACDKESADEFNFCPHCGKAFVRIPSVIESPIPSPEVQSVQNAPTDESDPIKDGVAGTAIRVGTFVFGAFSAISLLVSIIKGIVPIYLLEAAGWAGAAWYWQGKKTHSDVAKAIVIVLAVLVGIGEAVYMVSQARSKPAAPTAADPFAAYGGHEVASAGAKVTSKPTATSDPFAAYGGHEVASAEVSVASHVAEIEKQAIALFNQKHYTQARSIFEQACNGTDENGFKYAGFDGEMKACNYLGYLYAKGLGGARDTKKARDVYQRACDQGTLSSCASLGSLYQDAGNSEEARKYFNKACLGGITEACGLLHSVE
jgi:tetratricopeptide (TPR) repeat protein